MQGLKVNQQKKYEIISQTEVSRHFVFLPARLNDVTPDPPSYPAIAYQHCQHSNRY